MTTKKRQLQGMMGSRFNTTLKGARSSQSTLPVDDFTEVWTKACLEFRRTGLPVTLESLRNPSIDKDKI